MSDTLLVTADQKQAAYDHTVEAIHTLQSPQNGNTFASNLGAPIALSEENRRKAVFNLLSAAELLIPPDHPDVPIRQHLATWLNSQPGLTRKRA